METSIFQTAFFGYKNLLEYEKTVIGFSLKDKRLIPIKKLKLEKGYSVNEIRTICRVLDIPVHRPVPGLYCLEEKYCKFIDHAYHLFREGFWKDNHYYADLMPFYKDFMSQIND
jgi:hypothetical protein